MITRNTLIHGDCLELMKEIPDGSIDLVLADLPYGTTALGFDSIIPFEPLWAQYKRVIKKYGAIVLFGAMPFTLDLCNSNRPWLKYTLVWEKSLKTGFMSAKNRPLKAHEDIVVFSEGTVANCSQKLMPYYPQGLRPCNIDNSKTRTNLATKRACFTPKPSHKPTYIQSHTGYPSSVLKFANDTHTVHPTQKPVALLEYLIKTYTLPGEWVLDNCAGSGSTCLAAINTGRDYLAYELDKGFYDKAVERIANHRKPASLDALFEAA